MKKAFAVLLVVCFLLVANASYAAQTIEEKMVLSEMTEEECLGFIEEHGVSIPKELTNYEELGEFVKKYNYNCGK